MLRLEELVHCALKCLPRCWSLVISRLHKQPIFSVKVHHVRGKSKNNSDRGKLPEGGQSVSRPPRQITMNVPSPLTIRQQPDPEAKTRYSEEKSDRQAQVRAANRLNWITVIGAILTLLSLGGLYLTLLQTRRQFALDQRPYMTVDTAFYSDPAGKKLDDPVIGQPLALTSRLDDIGKILPGT